VSGFRILQNLESLVAAGARIILRCPIIPDGNDSLEHFEKIKEYESCGKFEAVERLPYHTLGEEKYKDLDRRVYAFSSGTRDS
jgi:pyruvate-formate lyase-activating enzyme